MISDRLAIRKVARRKISRIVVDVQSGSYGTKIASPWVQYVNALEAMFSKDKEVKIDYDNDNHVVCMRVDNPVKADAISKLLPESMTYGEVVLKINVVSANEEMTKKQLYEAAFNGNSAFKEAVPMEGVFTNPLLYIVFAKEVVQYYNDDLSDLHGYRSTLYQEIAKEIFKEHDGVLFCTDCGSPYEF